MLADRMPRGWLQIARRDMGNLAIHWTKPASVGDDFMDIFEGSGKNTTEREADAVLDQILNDAGLRGGTGYIKDSYTCVCFTEAPLIEMVSVFASIAVAGQSGVLRYQPYGIGVTKEWLFRRGGRPVIYQPDAEYEQLPEGIRWRHCRFEPPDIDFTWEREWRIPRAELRIDPAQTLVFVPSQTIADRFKKRYGRWRLVPLELFGFPSVGDAISRREA